MSESRDQEKQALSGEPVAPSGEEPLGDALRAAVERTLETTAGSAVETRQRAEELLDEVVRIGESARDEVIRRGTVARDEVQRRREAAGARIAEAIGELRSLEAEAGGRLERRVSELEQRVAELEAARDAGSGS